MKRQSVIIYSTPIPECYGNLKLFCETKGLKYNTYSKEKLPFEYDGYLVHRVLFQSGSFEPQAGEKKIKTETKLRETRTNKENNPDLEENLSHPLAI